MKPQDHLLAVPRISYWLAIFDYGPKLGIGPSRCSGCPEFTRADIVSEVREHIAKDGRVVHVRKVDGTDMEDLTQEILTEAIYQLDHEAA